MNDSIIRLLARNKVVWAVGILFSLWIYGEIKYRFAVNVVDYSELFRTKTQRKSTDFLIIHHTAILGDSTSILGIYDFHKHTRKYTCGVAYHWIQMKGVTYKIHSEYDATAHATSYNYNSISICVQENFSEHEVPTSVYWEVAALASRLSRKYNIPIENIKAHREVERQPTECPGNNFDMETLRKWVRFQQIFI